MKRIWTFIRHNYLIFVSSAVCVLMVFYAYSCQSTVVSIVNPNTRITREGLVLEVDTFLATAALRFDDLDRQDLVKNTIFNSVLDFVQGKEVNPIGVVTSLLGILGIGAIGDNIRKRTHINTLKGSISNAKDKILS